MPMSFMSPGPWNGSRPVRAMAARREGSASATLTKRHPRREAGPQNQASQATEIGQSPKERNLMDRSKLPANARSFSTALVAMNLSTWLYAATTVVHVVA